MSFFQTNWTFQKTYTRRPIKFRWLMPLLCASVSFVGSFTWTGVKVQFEITAHCRVRKQKLSSVASCIRHFVHRQGFCWLESGSAVVIRPQESAFLQTALNDMGSHKRLLPTYVAVRIEKTGLLSREMKIERYLLYSCCV